jgi:integrase
MVRTQFPDLSPATFWRCVKRVIEIPEADRYNLARGQRPAAEPLRSPLAYHRVPGWSDRERKAAREADRAAASESPWYASTSAINKPSAVRPKSENPIVWPTVGELVPLYEKEVLSKHRRGVGEHRSLLRVCEPLWDRRCVDVAAEDLEPILGEIARDAPVHANRVRAYYSAFCAWAIEKGHTNYNPTVDLERSVEEPRRERTLSLAEIVEVWRAANELGYPFGLAIQLLILTAARRGHVDSMRRSEIGESDTGGRNWTLTNHRRGGSRQFTIPLSPLAQEILGRAVRASPPASDLVFTTTGSTPISGWSRAKRDLDEIMRSRRLRRGAEGNVGLPPWRLDDLRRSFIRVSLDHLDGDPEVLNRCLDLMTDVRERFDGLWFPFEDEIEPRRDALFAWAELVERAVG